MVSADREFDAVANPAVHTLNEPICQDEPSLPPARAANLASIDPQAGILNDGGHQREVGPRWAGSTL